MKYRDEIHIALMTIIFCGVMFAIYAVVPKDAQVAAKAKATITEAPETAAEAEAIRSSQEEDAGFTIYNEESNYDDYYDDSSDTYYDESDTSYTDDTTNYDTSSDTTSENESDVAYEDSTDTNTYDSSNQIDYSSDTTDTTSDTSSDENWDYVYDTSTDSSNDVFN